MKQILDSGVKFIIANAQVIYSHSCSKPRGVHCTAYEQYVHALGCEKMMFYKPDEEKTFNV